MIGALSWNSKEFQVLLVINFEFLGISRFLEPELLQLGIPRNSQSTFTIKILTLFLGIPKSISQRKHNKDLKKQNSIPLMPLVLFNNPLKIIVAFFF